MSETTKDVEQFDLGSITVPRGTAVVVAATDTDRAFTGTLSGVEYRNGVAYTAQVWTGKKFRFVYVERVTVKS